MIQWLQTRLGLSPELEARLLGTLVTVMGLWLLHRLALALVYRRVRDPWIRYRWRKSSTYALLATGIVIVGRMWFAGVQALATFLGLVGAGGLRTACVERDPTGLGGTCLLRGCIPTKALLHTADLYEEIKHGKEYGIVADGLTLDFAAVMSRKSRIVNRLSKGIESYLFKKNKITLFKGQARLEGAGNVVVKGEGGETRVKTKNVILATGSRPRTLPGLAIDGKTIVSSDEILQIAAVPRSLVVIGAGSVGMEFAWLFARFGSAVTVIELLPRVLPLEDEEISTEAGKLPAKSRTIHTGAKTEGALKTAQGVEVAFRAADGQARSVTAEVLLVAVGRGPVTDGLGLESTKVQLDRGNIRVDA